MLVSGSTGYIKENLKHFTESSIESYLEKQNQYTSIQALKDLKRPNLLKLFINPLFRFFKYYFLKKGFLDGIPGLIHLTISCFSCFLKYAKLYEKHKKNS